MSTNTLTLDDRNTTPFEDLFTGESNVWASLDSTYERGLRAGQAQALRDHLGLILTAAQTQIDRRPQDRAAVLSFIGTLQKVLVGDQEGEADPFEFDGGLGI